jgi:hypothetical protein
MSAEAIFRVTQVLRSRLQQAVVAAGDPGTVFVGPLDDPDAPGASLILFLYRVTPNASLRNREHVVVSNAPPPPQVVYRNALPLDLYFLLTVGTRAGLSEEPLLRVLGFAMQELQRDPELTGPLLGYEAVHLSLEPLSTEEASRIWQLFPTANYRTSVAYLATPVWIDPPLPPAGAKPVVQDELLAGASAPAPATQP